MQKGRKPLIVCSIVVLCALVVCTFLSKSIYNAMLPAVETGEVENRELYNSYYGVGELTYSDRTQIRLSTTLRVLTVEGKTGQSVQADTVLFTVDVSDCELTAREMELSIQQLEQSLTPTGLTAAQREELYAERDLIVTQIEQIYDEQPTASQLSSSDASFQIQQLELQLLKIDNQLTPAGITAAQRDLVNAQRQLLVDKLERYRTTYPADGQVLAGVAGKLEALTVTAGMTLGAETVAAEIIPADSAQSVALTLPPSQAEQLEAGDKAMLSYSKREGSVTSTATITKKITEKTYDAQTGLYRFTIALQPEDGVTGTVSVQLVKSYGWFEQTVPLTAVTQTGEDSYCIYVLRQRSGLFGDEWYASRIEVEKLVADSLYMAVNSPELNSNTDVIVSATGTLYDGASVRVQRG